MTHAPGELERESSVALPPRRSLRAATLDLLTTRPLLSPLGQGWVWPVVWIWALGRAVNLALLGIAFQVSLLSGWTFGPDGETATTFLNFLAGWDAHWYGMIATEGYPAALPVDPQGSVQRNSWAFLPVFPFLERVLSDVSGMPWQLTGVLLSLVASCAATIALYVLLRQVAAPRASWWAVVLFSIGPLSFVFVVGYAESLFLLLLFAALLLAVRRRYLWIAPIGVVAAFTRPGALALALGLGILLLARWMRRAEDPLSRSQATGLIVSGLATAASGLLWPIIADVVTGRSGAYVQTETAWWQAYLGPGEYLPLAPGLLLGWTWLGPVGVLLVIALAVALFRWILSRPVCGLGLEIVAFSFSYALYLFAVFLPTQSLPRLLLPLSPLLADSRIAQTRRRRRWSVAVSLALQPVAVLLLWTIGNP